MYFTSKIKKNANKPQNKNYINNENMSEIHVVETGGI